MTWQGYKINSYTFYMVQQDDKSTNPNSGVCIDAYDTNMQKSAYYGQIKEIWELDYIGFKVPLFHCCWVQGPKGEMVDKYGIIIVDLQRLRHKDEPFILAKHVKSSTCVTQHERIDM